MTRPIPKIPEFVFLEPFCNRCYRDEERYFNPAPHGRQWATEDLWPDAKCDKCKKKIIPHRFKFDPIPDRGNPPINP